MRMRKMRMHPFEQSDRERPSSSGVTEGKTMRASSGATEASVLRGDRGERPPGRPTEGKTMRTRPIYSKRNQGASAVRARAGPVRGRCAHCGFAPTSTGLLRFQRGRHGGSLGRLLYPAAGG